MAWIFWTSLFLLLYLYLGYPVWLWVTRPFFPPASLPAPGSRHFDVVMSSHLEGSRLNQKIREVYAQGRELGLRRLLVGLDGADASLPDLAADLLASGIPVTYFPDQEAMPVLDAQESGGCFLIEFRKREGKPACLNRLLTGAESEWVIFLDVRQRLGEGCLQALHRHFSDPDTHVVSGNLEWEARGLDSQTGAGVGIYWAYEKWIRRQESRRGKVPGATGACYALRRSMFRNLPEDTLVDDVLIPLQACSKGGKCLFEEQAKIFDVPSGNPGQETLRKRRTIAGIFQLAVRHPRWNVPGGHPFWFMVLSHKTLRLTGPFLLLTLLVSNLLLAGQEVYGVLALGQGFGYLLAAFSHGLRGIPLLGKISSGAYAFVLLNGCCLMAILDAMTGRFEQGWDQAYAGPAGSESGGADS